MKEVRFVWDQLMPDPRRFKPGSPVLKPVNVKVVVTIPDEFVIEESDDEILISPQGMAECIRTLEAVIGNLESESNESPVQGNPEDWDESDDGSDFDEWDENENTVKEVPWDEDDF